MEQNYYDRFPDVLKQALKNGLISLEKEDILWDYPSFRVFRIIKRKKGEDFVLNEKDFWSKPELLGSTGRVPTAADECEAGYYSCSFFTETEPLEILFKLPKPQKKLAEGNLESIYGPVRINDGTKHVDCWLYNPKKLVGGFKIVEDEKSVS
ncbi:MAG: hypothetical protein IIU03_09195 [Bacteroidales bacterium]|nr:hypothetical protein [Bacteroidales bacterium]